MYQRGIIDVLMIIIGLVFVCVIIGVFTYSKHTETVNQSSQTTIYTEDR